MIMTSQEALFDYTIRQADNCLILGQRIGEWCGHGPVLEQDIALTNIALDLIGQSRSLYQYAAEIEGKGRTEDDLAYLRDGWEFKNLLMVEQPNGDFAYTITKQFFIDNFNVLFYQELCHSSDEQLSAVGYKSVKEANYHLKWSGDWVRRLGDGTEESHRRMTSAIEALWEFTGELFIETESDKILKENSIGVDLIKIKPIWEKQVAAVLTEATLEVPNDRWMQSGGKEGRHSEHLGYILADLQFLQRAYPGAKW